MKTKEFEKLIEDEKRKKREKNYFNWGYFLGAFYGVGIGCLFIFLGNLSRLESLSISLFFLSMFIGTLIYFIKEKRKWRQIKNGNNTC